MIHRLSYHRGPRRPLEYALDPGKAPMHDRGEGSPEIVATNMTSSTVPEFIAEFDVFLAARPYAERPAIHIVLAPHPDDLERLTSRVRRELIETYLARQGLAQGPYVAVEHWDSSVRHYSIIASRVDASGDLVHSAWEGHAGRQVLYALEEKYGLVRTGRGPGRKAPNRDQLQRRVRLTVGGRSEPEIKEAIVTRIDDVARPGLSVSDLARALRTRGVSLRLRTARDGRITGVSYAWTTETGSHAMAGSSLGSAYTWPALQRVLGVSYDPARDPLEAILNPPEDVAPPATVPGRAVPAAVSPSLPEAGRAAVGESRPVQDQSSGPAIGRQPTPVVEQLLEQLEELRRLEAQEAELRREVADLEEPHWGYLTLNPRRHELEAQLSRLYPDGRGAGEALERLYEQVLADLRGDAEQAIATVVEKIGSEPQTLSPLRTRSTLFGERALTTKDTEVQIELPAILGHVRGFLAEKARIDAERWMREGRLEQARRELAPIAQRLRTLPSGRSLAHRAAAELLQLEPSYLRELQLRFPRAMKSVEFALNEIRSRGLGLE